MLLACNLPMLAVVKKRDERLDWLSSWILESSESERSKLKILIIDDEADAASINNQRPVDFENNEQLDPNDVDAVEATAINTHIRTILNNMPNNAYVGYTATPYASLLSDPHDNSEELGRSLYPRNFVMTLPKPDNHDGTFEFFDTNGLLSNQVGLISNAEAVTSSNPPPLQGEVINIPRQMKFCVADFFITGAIKSMRGFETSTTQC